MTPTWDNGVTRLYHADARRIPLADESVHCEVTSTPYWNLRDYGLAPSVWGGDSGCPHYWLEGMVAPGARSSDSKSGSKQQNANRRDRMPTSAFCGNVAPGWARWAWSRPSTSTWLTPLRFSVKCGGCCGKTAPAGSTWGTPTAVVGRAI